MSRVVGHERCPACAKLGKDRHGDNLAVYEDGGEHCFSCGYHYSAEKRPNVPYLEGSPKEGPTSVASDAPSLPYDVTSEIDPRASLWLRECGLTMRDVVEHRILWSPSWERLIFPVGDCWQGRYFGSDPKKAKWFTKGDIHNVIYKLGTGPEVVLVEDILSAIRVSKFSSCICLFGSALPSMWISRMGFLGSRFAVWLDFDKRVHSIQLCKRLQNLGFQARSIITLKDPKNLTDEEIQKEIKKST